jgi:hypothetical protein
MNICSICGEHEGSLSDEFKSRMMWSGSKAIFENLKETSENPKCDFIKTMFDDINDTQNKIKLIRAFLNDEINMFRASRKDIHVRLDQLGIVSSDLRVREISDENLKILEASIPHDIEVMMLG